MALLVDTWSAEVKLLEADGWVITSYHRYDPTRAEGLTPSGKAFTLDISRTGVGEAAICTLTIAGNVRVETELFRANWEPADATRNLILKTYRSFRGNER